MPHKFNASRLDLTSGEVVCSELTPEEVGDLTAVPYLLDQLEGTVSHFLAGVAFDGEPTTDLLATRFGSVIEGTIPPPNNAILVLLCGQRSVGR